MKKLKNKFFLCKYINILNNKHVISATSGKETQNTGSYFPHPFHLLSHIDSIILLSLILYEHSQNPWWLQLGSAKGKYITYNRQSMIHKLQTEQNFVLRDPRIHRLMPLPPSPFKPTPLLTIIRIKDINQPN